jgi:type IV pilus assembly protein PilZ
MNVRGRRDSEGPPAALSAPAGDAPDPHAPHDAHDSSSPSIPPVSSPDSRHERRSYERFEVTWSVDCVTDETFLYASIGNISEMGIFIRTIEPLAVGTQLTLRFAPPDSTEAFVLRGTVQWVNALRPLRDNPNPGMGIRFIDLSAEDRERIVETIRTIAYLRDNPRARD